MSDLEAAYRRLEDVIREVSELSGFEGVLTEWVIVTRHQRFGDDGEGICQYGKLLPNGGGQIPVHRVAGLLDFELTRLRAVIAED